MRGKPDKTRSASHQAVGTVAGCGASALSGLPITIQSVLFHKLRFQFHRTKTVDFAIDVMVAFNQADVFHFGANFQHRRATFHLQIFNDGNAVAVSQQIAVSIFNDKLVAFLCRFCVVPFVGTFRADVHAVIFVGVFGVAFWAVWWWHVDFLKSQQGKSAKKRQIAEKGRNYTQNPWVCRGYCWF